MFYSTMFETPSYEMQSEPTQVEVFAIVFTIDMGKPHMVVLAKAQTHIQDTRYG